jgi:predicted oxidoreductase (fatty acid repression mutant protein)
MMLRGRLLLRLKPDSDDAEEAELERILKNAMERDPDKATIQRKRILVLSRILLKKEWEKVKSELGQTT